MKKDFIIGILCLLFIGSCGTTSRMNYKTHNKKLVNRLIESNGNAFFISSTYITVSYIWSYSDTELSVYKLAKGKIVDEALYTIEDKPNLIIPPSEKDLFELDSCLELDGDMFGYWINKGEYIEQKELPINLDCFRQGKYKSDFLNEVVNGVNTYQIKW